MRVLTIICSGRKKRRRPSLRNHDKSHRRHPLRRGASPLQSEDVARRVALETVPGHLARRGLLRAERRALPLPLRRGPGRRDHRLQPPRVVDEPDRLVRHRHHLSHYCVCWLVDWYSSACLTGSARVGFQRLKTISFLEKALLIDIL